MGKDTRQHYEIEGPDDPFRAGSIEAVEEGENPPEPDKETQATLIQHINADNDTDGVISAFIPFLTQVLRRVFPSWGNEIFLGEEESHQL